MLQNGNVYFDTTPSDLTLGSQIVGYEGGDVYFNVPAGVTTTFTGQITDGAGLISQSAFAVTKEGLGTLVLAPAAQCTYKSLVVEDGTAVFANDNAQAYASGSNEPYAAVEVTGGATLDFGRLENLVFSNVSLVDGVIADGAFTAATSGTIELQYGLMAGGMASMGGAPSLIKEDYDALAEGACVPVDNIPSDTVVLTGNNQAFTGTASVDGGALEVDGKLGSFSVIVTDTGILQGSGTCSGNVYVSVYAAGGWLGLDGSIGAALTMGSLTLGSSTYGAAIVTEAENTNTGLLETADVTVCLTIDDGILTFNGASYTGFSPFQVLFHYSTLAGYANLTESAVALPPSGWNLVDDTTGSSIDLAVSNVLYWWGGSTGTWNGSSTNMDWSSSPTTDVPAAWQNNSNNPYVAVFDGAGGYPVALDNGFTAMPAAIDFLANGYSISGGAGIDLTANSSIYVASGIAATIASSMQGAGRRPARRNPNPERYKQWSRWHDGRRRHLASQFRRLPGQRHGDYHPRGRHAAGRPRNRHAGRGRADRAGPGRRNDRRLWERRATQRLNQQRPVRCSGRADGS